MTRGGVLRQAALLAALVGSAAFAQTPAARGTAPPGVEPTDAQLPAVDPAWRTNGWRAVVPHAYVLRKLASVRAEPNATSPAAFYLKGGTRVPVLEQRSDWWRVSWTGGRSGWLRVSDLEPHASWVILDARTGKMTRRLAAKGQWGVVASGNRLWSISDRGITRTELGNPPVFWANPVRVGADLSITGESAWPANHRGFVFRTKDDLSEVGLASTETGEIRKVPGVKEALLETAFSPGRILVQVSVPGHDDQRDYIVYDADQQREVARIRGQDFVATKAGQVFVIQGSDLVRCDSALKPLARLHLAQRPVELALSQNETEVAVTCERKPAGKKQALRTYEHRILRADNLQRLATLPGGEDGPEMISTFRHTPKGWWLLTQGEEEGELLTLWGAGQKPVRTWESVGQTVMSPSGNAVYVQSENSILAVDTQTGRTRRFPFAWRRPLPQQYLPKASEGSDGTHLDVSNLAITPDGRYLILTEWLNGDPAG